MSKLTHHKFYKLYEMSSGISSTPEQAGHGSPFLSFSTVYNNYFIPEKLNDLMDTSEAEQKKYSVLKGDIFLTRTSEVVDELAMSSVALKDYPCATFSGFLKRLRPLQVDVTYHKFMAFYLRSKLFRKTMTNNAVLTLRASLNENIFSYLDLILPEYKEQVKIGELLHLLNLKIDLNNRSNAEMEAMAKTLYDYWFVQFDFPFDFAQGKPGNNGKPYKSSGGRMVWNKELKREIPEGWDSITISQLLTKESATNKISSSDILLEGSIPVIDQSTDYIAGYTNDESSRIKCEVPKIVFGDHTRILKFINFDFARGADGTQTMLSNSERMPQSLFYHTMLKIDLSNYGYARHYKFLKDQRIILPDEAIAQKYNGLAHTYYELIRQNIFENQHLSSLRDWLLPMLMNGQVKVS